MAKKTLITLFIVLALSVVALFVFKPKPATLLPTEGSAGPDAEPVKNPGIIPPVLDTSAADRAALLLKQFNNGTYPKVRLLQSITAPVVEQDSFGALIETGATQSFAKNTYDRATLFLKATTKKGNLVVLAVASKKLLSIDSKLITLTY